MRGMTDGVELLGRIESPGTFCERFVKNGIYQKEGPAGGFANPAHGVFDRRSHCMGLESIAVEGFQLFCQEMPYGIVPAQRIAHPQQQ